MYLFLSVFIAFTFIIMMIGVVTNFEMEYGSKPGEWAAMSFTIAICLAIFSCIISTQFINFKYKEVVEVTELSVMNNNNFEYVLGSKNNQYIYYPKTKSMPIMNKISIRTKIVEDLDSLDKSYIRFYYKKPLPHPYGLHWLKMTRTDHEIHIPKDVIIPTIRE